MPDNGVILVVTDAGTKQKELEESIRKKSLEKNIKIFFTFYPSCRADCDDSLPVYERLSDGNMMSFETSVFRWHRGAIAIIDRVLDTVCDDSAGF